MMIKKDLLVDSETNETIVDEVDEGLLSDDQNIMEDGLETNNVSGGQKLVIGISMHTKDEIGGTIYENESGNRFLSVSSYEHTAIERNENGDVVAMTGGFSLTFPTGKFTSKDGSFTGGSAIAQFHSHPGHPDVIGNIGTAIPSTADMNGVFLNSAYGDYNISYYIYGAKQATINGVTSNTSITTVPNPKVSAIPKN